MSSEFKRLFSKGPPKNPKINVKATGEKEFVDCFIQTYRSSSSICPLNLVPDKENNSKKKKEKYYSDQQTSIIHWKIASTEVQCNKLTEIRIYSYV